MPRPRISPIVSALHAAPTQRYLSLVRVYSRPGSKKRKRHDAPPMASNVGTNLQVRPRPRRKRSQKSTAAIAVAPVVSEAPPTFRTDPEGTSLHSRLGSPLTTDARTICV